MTKHWADDYFDTNLRFRIQQDKDPCNYDWDLAPSGKVDNVLLTLDASTYLYFNKYQQMKAVPVCSDEEMVSYWTQIEGWQTDSSIEWGEEAIRAARQWAEILQAEIRDFYVYSSWSDDNGCYLTQWTEWSTGLDDDGEDRNMFLYKGIRVPYVRKPNGHFCYALFPGDTVQAIKGQGVRLYSFANGEVVV